MDSLRLGLKVEDGKLFGRRLFTGWIPIAPEDISKVREYGGNNPFIRLWTTRGKFIVGAQRAEYLRVTEYLKQNRSFDLTKTLLHRWNVAFYATSVLPAVGGWLKKLLRRQKSE